MSMTDKQTAILETTCLIGRAQGLMHAIKLARAADASPALIGELLSETEHIGGGQLKQRALDFERIEG